MISYLGLVVQSCYGEGGALQTDIAVCGEHSPCSGHTGFAPHRGVCAFPIYTAQAPGCSIWSGQCIKCGSSFGSSTKAWIRLRLRVVSSPASAVQAARSLRALSPDMARLFPLQRAAQAARGLRALSPGAVRLFPPWRVAQAARGLALSPRARGAFSLRGPSTRRRSGLRKSLDRNRGLFAGWEGVASLGLSLPLSPPPCLLPPARMGRLFSGVSQSLCFANRRQCVPAG